MWNSRLSFAFLFIVGIENNNSSSKNKWTRKNLYLTGIRIGLHTLYVPTLKPLDIILVSFTKSWNVAFGWNIENRDVFETPVFLELLQISHLLQYYWFQNILDLEPH